MIFAPQLADELIHDATVDADEVIFGALGKLGDAWARQEIALPGGG